MTDTTSIKSLSVKEFLNSFSLLVVFGSVSTSYFFARVFHAEPSYWFYHLLGTTVWAIYTTDHILDGIRNDQMSLALRHQVHARYRWILGGIVLIVGGGNLFIAIHFLPDTVLFYGAILALIVGGYLLMVHLLFKEKRFFGKEIVIAVGVTGGMAFLPAVQGAFEWNLSNVLLLLVFTLLNLANLLIFAYFDRDHDLKSGFDSLVQRIGPNSAKQWINNLLVSIFVLIGFWAFTEGHDHKLYIAIVFLFMLHVLVLIMLREDDFIEQERYRFWGDFIYLIPGLFWIFLVEQLI